MKCTTCGHDNPADNRFCGGCGAALDSTCPSCGRTNPPDHRFCGGCGNNLRVTNKKSPLADRKPRDYTPKHLADKILQSKSALEGERKQVTVMFADIQGSMRLANELEAEQWHVLLERYFEILTDAVHRFEGTVNQYTGDGIMALFGAPIAHEDHAQRACYAALDARDKLRVFADELRVSRGLNFSFRIGINSGEVIVGRIGDDLRMDYTAQGATVGIAQRIEQLAAPGHVYVSGATERLAAGFFQLRPMGETQLKNVEVAVPLFELEARGSARSRLDVAVARGLSRFVGRATEMETLEAALARAERGQGQVIGIVGEPGLGKSRLCLEFVERCRRKNMPVFEAHCPAHGKTIPYLPILELFRNYFDIEVNDSATQTRKKVAGTLLLLDPALQDTLPVLFEFMAATDPDHPPPSMDPEAKQRQLYELMHRLVRAQDAERRVSVTLIDDLHWVDPGSDGFINQLVNAVEGKHSLIVLNFRPEYHAAFAAKAHYQQLPLVPLGDAALKELISDLIGQDGSVSALTERIIKWTTGNPFYTEELITTLVEAGDLVGHPGHYRLVTALERLVVPSNVRAVLAARIDRLPDQAKRLLQTAAVIGKSFSSPLLEAVTDLSAHEYTAALERLKTGDFIYEQSLYPVFEYAFKHPLTHEVAYQSQLHSRRAAVHAAVARALEAQAGEKLDERAALLAHHYEAADDVRNAARWHQYAAEWATRNDFEAAMFHWLRVRDLARRLEDESESAALVALACSRALASAWRVGALAETSAGIFDQGCSAAKQTGNEKMLASITATYGLLRGSHEAGVLDYVKYATEAVRIADRTGDVALRAGTRVSLAWGHVYCGQLKQALPIADEAIALAAGDPDLGSEVVGLSPLLASRNVHLHAVGCMGDPSTALREYPLNQRASIESGYIEHAVFAIVVELELRYALGNTDGIHALTQKAARLAENLGALNELGAAIGQCDVFACDQNWTGLMDKANELLGIIRERRVGLLWEPRLLALIGIAQLELGNRVEARAAASEGTEFMRKSHSVWNPHSYAVLVRAQLALAEATENITRTLDEYQSLLARTGFHVYEGELHELYADLAAREGQPTQRIESLGKALACYNRFGMTTQAARVAAATESTSN